MPNYDFTTLSPSDLELLTRDLLQAELDVHVESFKSGRDGGIDLRYARYVDRTRHTTIVQCKRYCKTGFAGLKAAIDKTEVPKLKKLNPGSYRLVTSVPLSPKNKDALLTILKPYTTRPEDVLGCEDLNNLIGKHPDIERKHFKLWIGSVAVLQRILSNDIFSRTYLDTTAIKRRLSLFVRTPALDRALEILIRNGYCLLSGIPGIGKTTTAEMLLAIALEQGWEAVHLGSGVSEAFKALQLDTRQVFFYDDFLGRTSLLDNALGKNEDRDLVRLFQLCRQSGHTKRAILTTREYILQQARQSSEVLHLADLSQCIVSLEDYTRRIRAEILINHLYFYDVPEETRRTLVTSGAAAQIIGHRNYSPRIVEWMCEANIHRESTPDDFAATFLRTLDDPSKLWQHAFENQISPTARELMLGIASLGDDCEPDALFSAVLSFRGVKDAPHAELLALRKALAELEGNFLRIEADNEVTAIKFHNPSVKDFTDRLLDGYESTAVQLYLRAVHFEQLVYLTKNHRCINSRIDDASLFRKVLETYTSAPATLRVHVRQGQRRIVRRQIYISERLTHCLKMAINRSRELQIQLARLALSYLSAPRLDNDSASDCAELYKEATKLLCALGQSVELAPLQAAQALRSELCEACDFTAVAALLDWEHHEEFLQELSNDFVTFAEAALDDVTSNARSSTEVRDCVTELQDVAGVLGVESEIDFDTAETLVEKLSDEEEHYAEMHGDDDYRGSGYVERDDRESAEEMLNSLVD